MLTNRRSGEECSFEKLDASMQRRYSMSFTVVIGILTLILASYCTAAEQFSFSSLAHSAFLCRGGGFSGIDDTANDSKVLKKKNRRRLFNIFNVKSDAMDEALAEAKFEKNGRGGALALAKQSQTSRIENRKPLLLITNKMLTSTNATILKKAPKSVARVWWTSVWEESTSNVPVVEEEDTVSMKDARKEENSVIEADVKNETENLLESQEDTEENPSQIENKTEEESMELDEVEERKNVETAAAIVEESESLSQGDVEQNDEVHNLTQTKKEIVDESISLSREQDAKQKDTKEDNDVESPSSVASETPYTSSGYWRSIDRIASLNLSQGNPQLRLSRQLRPIRKAAAKATGMSGVLSGKQRVTTQPTVGDEEIELGEEDLGRIQQRLKAIDRARKLVKLKEEEEEAAREGMKRRRFFRRRKGDNTISPTNTVAADDDKKEKSKLETINGPNEEKALEEKLGSKQRHDRVEEIDKLITEGQQKLQELICEKDSLQRRPSPLYNYTASTMEDGGSKFSREFNFPPDSLVDDYLEDIFATNRLVRMNHTHLWRTDDNDDDDDESVGDDLLTPSGDARKLYGKDKFTEEGLRSNSAKNKKSPTRNGGGGSWLLRQSLLGRRGSLGMKIGEIAEDSGYKAVCKGVMASLAQSIASLHGINVMTHSDIRLYVEQAPDLPPIRRNSLLEGNSYAEEAIKSAVMKGRKRRKKGMKMSQETFIQRDAVVETLLSHVQISAPLLKLFPLIWQRALLANMITLITQIVSDFCSGIELQILGHSLTLSFKPISESDLIRHIGLAGKGFNHRRAKPGKFEAAVKATAEDVAKNLQFLDRWHERALGGDMLRAQIANLIARLVLTLTDEVLSGARMDLWAAQAGGPRVVAGLEYRTPALTESS